VGIWLPVFGSIFIWSLSVCCCVLYTTYYFAPNLVPKKHRAKVTPQMMRILIVAITIMFPFLCSILFAIGSSTEGGDWILWGCYIEYLEFGLFSLHLLLQIPTVILFIIGMINPPSIRFQSRIGVAVGLLVNIFYSGFMVWVIGNFVRLFSGDLHGLDASCL